MLSYHYWGERFSTILYGNQFTIITDHKALVWLNKHKDYHSKLMRWSLELQGYDYQIIYKPEKDGSNADALFRLIIKNIDEIIKLEEKQNEVNKSETREEKTSKSECKHCLY
jgi:hypothetical protein